MFSFATYNYKSINFHAFLYSAILETILVAFSLKVLCHAFEQQTAKQKFKMEVKLKVNLWKDPSF